eukprot:2497728-Rhodomonas_salina.1
MSCLSTSLRHCRPKREADTLSQYRTSRTAGVGRYARTWHALPEILQNFFSGVAGYSSSAWERGGSTERGAGKEGEGQRGDGKM